LKRKKETEKPKQDFKTHLTIILPNQNSEEEGRSMHMPDRKALLAAHFINK
jgi:hypothetical protein